jgi:hypothetical protein
VGVGVPVSVVPVMGVTGRRFFVRWSTAGGTEGATFGVVAAFGVVATGGAGVVTGGATTRGGGVCRGTSRGTGGRAVSVVSPGVAVGRTGRGETFGRLGGGVDTGVVTGVVAASTGGAVVKGGVVR